MTEKQGTESDVVRSFIEEANKLVAGTRVIFAEILSEDDNDLIRIGIELPEDVSVTSSQAYSIQELADVFTEEKNYSIAVSFSNLTRGYTPIELNMPDDLKSKRAVKVTRDIAEMPPFLRPFGTRRVSGRQKAGYFVAGGVAGFTYFILMYALGLAEYFDRITILLFSLLIVIIAVLKLWAYYGYERADRFQK